jgi:hypothetical protein
LRLQRIVTYEGLGVNEYKMVEAPLVSEKGSVIAGKKR